MKLPSGEAIGVLGQGTWGMGEDPARHDEEIAALRLGLDLGMGVIDTSETYAGGRTELMVGEAIAGRRDDVFLITKVAGSRANHIDTIAACEGSLRRLGTDHIDLYLIEGRGEIPLHESITALAELIAEGMIRYWGVTDFGLADLVALTRVPGGGEVAMDQVLYNLARRGTEFDLLAWLGDRGVPVVAYAPTERGALLGHPVVVQVASALGVTPAQVAIAWVLHQEGVGALSRARRPAHVRLNREAADLSLPDRYLAKLELAFPPPVRARPLEVL